jgi:hypothetical protein
VLEESGAGQVRRRFGVARSVTLTGWHCTTLKRHRINFSPRDAESAFGH